MKKIQWLLCGLLVFLLLAFTGCGKEKPEETDDRQVLNLFSWADNFDPEMIKAFEKKYHCKVNYDVFANNEELLAKLQAGGAQYDLIQPSDYMVSTMIKLDLLEKLDKEAIPNAQNVMDTLQHPDFDPKGEYSVVYTWGMTGIVYNKKYIKEPPTSWNDLWKPEYKGRVILLNDSREVFGMALKKNGWSNNSTDPAQLKKAYEDLALLVPNILAYDTDGIKQKFIAEEAWIGTMWSGDASYSYHENPNLGFVIPKEGTLVWADTLAIPKGARHKKLAEAFINFLFDPQVSAKNYEAIGYNDPNSNARQYHSQEYLEDPMLNAAITHLKEGEWLHDIGDAITMYDRYWTELKTIR
ncbi:polyamine ABC transporter substrate-binding protein [Acidaminococcus timonensis]|uniref:polyamine ABC transporter substrate-binding protein n=1 Tax=Acidaminococcus timonensis TaxID=1871002 RepID=UPI002666ADA0|nr:spermidine/putrescine ABC transporter substrate-binding protein [uncultured Acidaminococcus sp.]